MTKVDVHHSLFRRSKHTIRLMVIYGADRVLFNSVMQPRDIEASLHGPWPHASHYSFMNVSDTCSMQPTVIDTLGVF